MDTPGSAGRRNALYPTANEARQEVMAAQTKLRAALLSYDEAEHPEVAAFRASLVLEASVAVQEAAETLARTASLAARRLTTGGE